MSLSIYNVHDLVDSDGQNPGNKQQQLLRSLIRVEQKFEFAASGTIFQFLFPRLRFDIFLGSVLFLLHPKNIHVIKRYCDFDLTLQQPYNFTKAVE